MVVSFGVDVVSFTSPLSTFNRDDCYIKAWVSFRKKIAVDVIIFPFRFLQMYETRVTTRHRNQVVVSVIFRLVEHLPFIFIFFKPFISEVFFLSSRVESVTFSVIDKDAASLIAQLLGKEVSTHILCCDPLIPVVMALSSRKWAKKVG